MKNYKWLAVIALAIVTLTSQSHALNINFQSEPEVIDLVPIPSPTPEPIPYTGTESTDVAISQSDIDTLAEFLWKSPLRYEHSKRELLWVVFNRIDDNSGLFGDSIEDVCRNKREFTFMSAHRFKLSDENLRIAREELRRWLSTKLGSYVGEHHNGVYCAFVGERNRSIEVYDKNWKEVNWE